MHEHPRKRNFEDDEEGRECWDQRNFWRAWHDEQRHYRHEHHEAWRNQPGQNPPPEEVQAWREFFHRSTGDWPENHWIFGGRRFSPWHQGMDSFNPFVASLLSKGGGLLPLYVLHLIARKPRYGNEIMDILAEGTNGQWVSNPGAVYPLLTLLERQGFISGQWEDPDKRTVRIYAITPEGRKELDRIRAVVMPKIEETIKVLQEFLQELGKEPTPSNEPDTSRVNGTDDFI
jgi:DNA-binding PadR family transcriptional regulator